MHVPIPAFIMETIWSIVCRMRGVSAATNPPTVSPLLPPLNAIPLYISYSLSCLVPFAVSRLARLLYEPRVFFLACSCSRTCRASLYVVTRVLLIARLRSANAKDFRLHA